MSDPEVGYDVPARIGMREAEIQTPCLILDLDALERNLRKMGAYVAEKKLALRVHGKMHKSVDVAKLQAKIGGATGVCCQKVSEAEAFVRGGVSDVLISNQVRDPVKIDRLARLAAEATITVCVDDPANVVELSAAAARHGAMLGVLVEIDCGAGRCGVASPEAAVEIARAADQADALTFLGVQAYQGAMQHFESYGSRREAAAKAHAETRETVEALTAAGLAPQVVTGAGTGSFPFEAASGLYTELQCGSYAFMDADYGRIQAADGARLDETGFENALFLLTSIMSATLPGIAVCDAGLKSVAVDSGLPVVTGVEGVHYETPSDEHGVISDTAGVLAINDRVRLIPGHCDPTCNLHDWYVGVRNGVVETMWPISARGKSF
ncbi:MAG: DSD1 family PLP-dependent enzyme [Pseudomonadota bacterium]